MIGVRFMGFSLFLLRRLKGSVLTIDNKSTTRLSFGFESKGAMPRPLPIEFAGAIYDLMSHGDRREPVFKDDQDRKVFLRTLEQACEKTGWQINAWCLMCNHFHIVAKGMRVRASGTRRTPHERSVWHGNSWRPWAGQRAT